MKRLIFVLSMVLMWLPFRAEATTVSVRIFADAKHAKMQFTAELGSYRIQGADGRTVRELAEGESVEMTVKGGKVSLSLDGRSLGSFSDVKFEGAGLKAIYGLRVESQGKTLVRYYDDHLEAKAKEGSLFLINHVDLENYVGGVVQSEVRGVSDKVDFFKVQAIISRTYAMSNRHRHQSEGYDLCDGVHCQVYHSRNNTPVILTATVQSAGLIIVDGSGKPITAAFHSNSGGQTANSEDAWNAPVSYLRSVEDEFSLEGKNAYWEKRMPRSEWLDFLSREYDYPVRNAKMKDSALTFSQPVRKAYFAGGIPLKDIRSDMKLRSSFFSVRTEGAEVVLEGRGYGHGVGLSQEGVVKMIDKGYSVEEVIKHYYTGVNITSLQDNAASGKRRR